MIIPTRFGLKYTPIPTLALEYEDDLKGVMDATEENPTSLYVYRDGKSIPQEPTRKLHVMELPMLTRTSETQQVVRQLQQDNGRFLASEVVSETQLKRLLDQLVENLPDPTSTTNLNERGSAVLNPAKEDASAREQEKNDAFESELEESEMEENVMEESAMEESAPEALPSQDHLAPQSRVLSTPEVNPNRGTFLSQDANDQEESHDDVNANSTINKLDDHGEKERSEGEDAAENDDEHNIATREEQDQEAEEDAKKTRALQSESDVSEEEVHSEELEYFSEDGSDEDSF